MKPVPMNGFYTRVSEFIAARHLLPPGSPVIAGISGGADSLALLLLLDRLRGPLNLLLTAAHLNHGLRGAAADEDQAFVSDWCSRLGIAFIARHEDVSALARYKGIGIEECGRLARLAFFNELADRADHELSGEADPGRPGAVIALAHHLDDQAETLLLHLGRGCGLDGLTGMKPATGRIIRPLLGETRHEIEAWLTGQGIAWRQDETNLDHFALRNRLRLQVLPSWSAALGYNPAPLLARTASSLEDDRQLLEDLASQAISRCRQGQGLQAVVLSSLEPALQNRVLRRYWRDMTGSSKDLSFKHINLVKEWLPRAVDGQQLCLPGHWRANLSNGLIFFKPVFQAAETVEFDSLKPGCQDALIRLELPRITLMPAAVAAITLIPQDNMQIEAELIEYDDDVVYNDTTEYFHPDRIDGCVVRHRLPGDYIHPFGRTGGKSLKKFLNEQRVPPRDRDTLPFVALGSEIVWIPGLAAGAGFVARPSDGSHGLVVRLAVKPMRSGDA